MSLVSVGLTSLAWFAYLLLKYKSKTNCGCNYVFFKHISYFWISTISDDSIQRESTYTVGTRDNITVTSGQVTSITFAIFVKIKNIHKPTRKS